MMMEMCIFLYLLPCAAFTLWIYISLIKPQTTRLPPGTSGWPVIGETLEYFSKLKNGSPERFVTDRIAKYSSKVFQTCLLGEPMAMLCGAEGNKFLFSNEAKLVRVWFPSSITKIFPKSDPVSMIRIRKLLQPLLKVNALRGYLPLMDSIMKQHLEAEWIGKSQVQVWDVVSKYTMTMACRLLLSIEYEVQVERLGKQIKDVVDGFVSMAVDLPGTAFRRAIRAFKAARGEIQGIVKKRKADILENNVVGKNDLLTQMIDENGEEETMSEFDIASVIPGLLLAGTHTLNSALTSIINYLAELPDVYREVVREQMEIKRLKEPKELLTWEDISKMRYSWNVANEVMRLRPPVFGTFREAISDFTYAGHTIPKGWKLHSMSHSTHRNPDYFPDPEKFDPSRFKGRGPPPFTFVPFGGGPRMCPGNDYARLVILVFMHNVVTKFRWEKVIADEKVVSDPVPRPAQGLPIFLYPHNP